MSIKRVLLIGDLHCGHRAGLTPPDYYSPTASGWRSVQSELWRWFKRTLDRVQDGGRGFDVAIWGGDLIDGDGRKTNGSEQITTDNLIQVEIAASVIKMVKATKHFFIRGTGYHTGAGQDYEDLIARQFGGEIHDELNLTINGHTINARHHSGRSSIPYGMLNAKKEKMWIDLLNARASNGVRVDTVVRWHVHWYRFAGDEDGVAFTMPALQYPMSKYGRRFLSDYSIGFVTMEIDANGGMTWRPHLARLRAGETPSRTL